MTHGHVGAERSFSTVIFDLDDCLYRRECGIADEVHNNIKDYMRTEMGIPEEEVGPLCQSTYLEYGTTMAGLRAMGYDIDDVKWHAVAHGRVRHEKHLTADPALRAMLASIPLPLYVFTNADDTHAEACLRLLGVRDLFKGVITYETMQRVAKERGLPASRVLCKPAVDAFEAALQLAGGAVAARTLFLDDSARNCGGAAAAGLTAVQVGAREPCEGALAALPDVRHLREVVPELWGAALAPAPAPATANEAVEHAVAETAAIEVVA